MLPDETLVEDAEVQDGPENTEVEEPAQDDVKSEGEADPVEGADDTEVGDDAEEAEESEEPAVNEVETLRSEIAQLKSQISALKQPEYKEPSPEEQAQMTEKYGMEYKSIQFMNSQMAQLGQAMKGYIDNLHSQLSLGNSLQEFGMKKGFEDIGKYKSEVQKFLVDNVDASKRSTPEAIETAYWVAKGKSMNKTVKTALTSREKNRKIVTSGRPASPTKGSAPTKSVKLTDVQRSAARAVGWSEKQYVESLSRKSA